MGEATKVELHVSLGSWSMILTNLFYYAGIQTRGLNEVTITMDVPLQKSGSLGDKSYLNPQLILTGIQRSAKSFPRSEACC